MEHAQMDREPRHFSPRVSRLWNDKMVRICNKASDGYGPDGSRCQLSYVNASLLSFSGFYCIFCPQCQLTESHLPFPYVISFSSCYTFSPSLYLLPFSPLAQKSEGDGRLWQQFKERGRRLWLGNDKSLALARTPRCLKATEGRASVL